MNNEYKEALRSLGLKASVELTPEQGTLVQRTIGTPLERPVVFSEFSDGVADPHGIGMERYLEIAHGSGPPYSTDTSISVEEFYDLVDGVLDPHGMGSRYHRTVHQEPQEQARIP